MNVKTFEELKLSGNLPSPAGVGMKILQLTRTEDYSADEMGEAIMADSSLTGRILKLANSASNSGLQPATTVSGAIMRLGSRTVRDLALAFSLVSERRSGTCRAFDYEQYWSRSLARAVSAQIICRVKGVGKPEEAYICGLLGEIGALALASVYSEKYSELLETVDVDDLLAAEQEAFNIDHAQVGACMLVDWGLPESFSEAVERFCPVVDLPEKVDGLPSALTYAEVVARACHAGEDLTHRDWARLGDGLEGLRKELGMDAAAFSRFCDTCVNEWLAWAESLDVVTAEAPRVSQIMERVRRARAALQRDGGSRSPQASARRPEAPRSADKEPGAEAIHVLAVDDDPVSLRILTRHLERDGYQVVCVRNGREALKTALSASPDIVIADWEMPDLDGLELCISLRRTDVGRNMYFLLLTGHESEELLVRAFDSGVDDFVVKPFIPRLLAARIKGGVRLAQLQRKIERDRQTMLKQVAELGMLTRKLRAASLTDPLTELNNRRYAMKRLESEWASTRRTARPMSLVMIDIDRFKDVNDTHGHDVGDLVLKEVAKVLQGSIRGADEVCRMGGEEFLIICKNTSEDECRIVAERVRSRVAGTVIAAPLGRSVTVSLGIASSEFGAADVDALFKAADEAVYLAKELGRNQTRTSSEVVQRRKSA